MPAAGFGYCSIVGRQVPCEAVLDAIDPGQVLLRERAASLDQHLVFSLGVIEKTQAQPLDIP
jgi:hypothetical protein